MRDAQTKVMITVEAKAIAVKGHSPHSSISTLCTAAPLLLLQSYCNDSTGKFASGSVWQQLLSWQQLQSELSSLSWFYKPE
jgi:hypothetical protein